MLHTLLGFEKLAKKFLSLLIKFQNSFLLLSQQQRDRDFSDLILKCGWTDLKANMQIPVIVISAFCCVFAVNTVLILLLYSLAMISSHMVLIHRLWLMPIVFDMRWLLDSQWGRRTCPKHLSDLFSTLFWLHIFFNMTSFLACVTKSTVRVISMINLWQTNVWLTCSLAVKNLALTKWSPYISLCLFLSTFFPKDHAGSISWCLDTCRGSRLDEEGCQRAALVNREIIQTVGH